MLLYVDTSRERALADLFGLLSEHATARGLREHRLLLGRHPVGDQPQKDALEIGRRRLLRQLRLRCGHRLRNGLGHGFGHGFGHELGWLRGGQLSPANLAAYVGPVGSFARSAVVAS